MWGLWRGQKEEAVGTAEAGHVPQFLRLEALLWDHGKAISSPRPNLFLWDQLSSILENPLGL